MSEVGGTPPPVVRDPNDDEEGSRLVREVAGRAIRRLGVLEAVILVAAVVLSLVAGAVAAVLLEGVGLPFRVTWAVASVLFFVAPALAIRLRDRRSP